MKATLKRTCHFEASGLYSLTHPSSDRKYGRNRVLIKHFFALLSGEAPPGVVTFLTVSVIRKRAIRAFIAFRLRELENYFRAGASMGSKLRYQFSVSPPRQFADRT